MDLLNKELIRELLSVSVSPCLSLYMPTHRSHPENLQDPIKFKNLVKQLEASLLQQYSSVEARQLLEPFEALGNNNEVWNQTPDGLAVFSADGLFKVIGLTITVNELVVAADSFYTKPLRRFLQSVDRYHVLCLSLHDMQLYEGNRHSLVKIELGADIPATIEKALGDELTGKHSTVASYGGVGGESSNMHHGHGGKKDEADIDAERFFRVVATNIYEKYSKPTGLPLILAALPEHHNLFKKVSKNPLLLPNGISVNPKAVPTDKLTKMAWEVMEPAYTQKLEDLSEKFAQAKAHGTGSDDMEKVAEAASAGRVDTLLLEAGRVIAGKIINSDTGTIETGDLENPEIGDLLDDIGEFVTKTGGQVMVIPPEKMPVQTGLAAIFRY